MPLQLVYVAISLHSFFTLYILFYLFISDVSAIRNILEETVKRLIFHVYLHHVRMEELANRLEIIMSANARQVRN